MYTRGEYITKDDCYGVLLSHSKDSGFEIALVSSGQIASAFKHDISGDYSFLNPKAKELYNILKNALVGCKPKNGTTLPFVLGTSVMYEFTRAKMENLIELYNGEIVKADISGEDGTQIKLEYATENQIPQNIPYIKLTSAKQPKSNSLDSQFSDDEVVVRSVEEIALEKEDVSWLKNKKYYIVNDDAQAEQIFAYLDNYNGPIAYDTETTGLKINCFGKINSEYKARLEKYNAEHPDEQLRADRLVGIIFCVEDHISYYFPCFNRKFKNLYEDDNEIRRKIINNIKARYTVGEYALKQSDMARYIRETPAEQWGSDVILMERVRNILQTKHIVAHNGSFEWKVGWQYEVDTNLCDDTMIMHQIMYKFRTTTSNRGEPSNLKYLAKVELGIDQWELSDFFPDFKEDNSGQVRVGGKGRGKKAGSKIDFSYMTYEGTRVYAPTDGDVTLLLFKKYKSDMIKNHKEQEYIYSVEVIVACCIGYMEFYGHRIDEEKIFAVRDQTKAEIACIESEIRQEVGFCKPAELAAYNELKNAMKVYAEADKSGDAQARANANQSTIDATNNLYKTIADDHEHELNLASPSQVAELFYDVLGYPVQGDKKSVAKKQIKPLVKALDEDGNLMYPVAKMYSDYKVKDTLMTKFFDNLTYYMYPGGLIFSSFGQISTATGRMSCSKPNAQQYPKAITSIVVPREGYIMMDADYSQIEYRVLTALAGNEWLAELFADPDSDYHTLMASLMYSVPYASVTPKMRSDAKSFNFGIPYGMGLKSLAILLKGNSKPSSVDEAKEKYELYFKNQPKTRKFFDQVKEMAQVNKFTRTFWNRYRYYSFTDAEGNENNARKAAALRQAGNAVIQGCISGDTRIQTKEFGIVKIKNVVGKRLHVWDGGKWSLGDITYSGKKQKCIVRFGTGQEFVCSPIHKFLVKSSSGKTKFIECQYLRSREQSHYPHKVVVDNAFLGNIGIDYNKQTSSVKSVDITDEYIDMYDVCNTDDGYYVADGIITHNTAADIFKISVARNFMYIRENHLLGELLIINMIHDEQLFEVDAQRLNMQRILADVGRNMQFKVNGFPPLYIGAGIGPAWGKAKGKMAEIHPNLLDRLTAEAQSIPIWRDKSYEIAARGYATQDEWTPEEQAKFQHYTVAPVDVQEILKYFADRVYEFRRQKVIDYITDSSNYGKDLHPAIGNLLNLQFTYGHDKDKEGLGDNEFTQLCLSEFIKANNIPNVTANMFVAQQELTPQDDEEDEEYSDDEEGEEDDDFEIYGGTFTVIDEKNELFGSSLQDLIGIFKFFVSPDMGVCGINSMDLSYQKKDELVDFLYKHLCEYDDEGAMELIFLQPGNILNRTGLYVKGITESDMEQRVESSQTVTA